MQIAGEGLRFRDSVPDFFKPYASRSIVAFRRVKAVDLVSALKKQTPEARGVLTNVFTTMRTPGLITTEQNGQRELVPLTIED